MANKPLEELFKEIPPPPEGSVFSLLELRHVNHTPHPYVVGPRHVAMASDKFGGRLSEDAIRATEEDGGSCYMGEGRWKNRCQIPYDKHTSEIACFISCPDVADLNTVTGLHAYLKSLQPKCAELGIAGFAFVKQKPTETHGESTSQPDPA